MQEGFCYIGSEQFSGLDIINGSYLLAYYIAVGLAGVLRAFER